MWAQDIGLQLDFDFSVFVYLVMSPLQLRDSGLILFPQNNSLFCSDDFPQYGCSPPANILERQTQHYYQRLKLSMYKNQLKSYKSFGNLQ